ncbi:MAG: FprA family A-type flavoprotein [Desulfohalobiaceae bacterium]|nr:FprA family A-type flavoprotein [Desulfohalobiaceae bacterium]
MGPQEIKPGIYWVGVVDWNLRNFHGYSQTYQGTTYNAYLVLDEKITLFDTVAWKYREEFMCQIAQVVEPEKIDQIVVHHVEPDHAGSLPYVVDRTRPRTIYASKMGEKFLRGRFSCQNWPLETVANGQQISLGKRSAQFAETRMLHWPDSMVSFIPEEKLLISQDAFGQNIASSERFDDWISWPELKREMAHYFANIILPYSDRVPKALEAIQSLGWDIQMIAPDHGLILQSHVADAVAAYQEFAAQKPEKKAVVFYDTMWQSTEKMAEALASGLTAQGVSVKLYHLKSWHHSDVMAQVWNAAAVVAGSPTHNNNVMPLVADMLTYMQGLRPKNKLGLAFGSYGWSGESPDIISRWLEQIGVEQPLDPFGVKHVPGHDTYRELVRTAESLAGHIEDKVRQARTG